MSLAEAAHVTPSSERSLHKKMADNGSYGGNSTPRAADVPSLESPSAEQSKKESKGKKRALFGFGKKKSETSKESPALPKDSSKLSPTASFAASPPRLPHNAHPYILPSSPGRALSGSPRVASPAGSQIFERDVQDSTVLKPSSPAIPTHIQTENYIPSVLDDASEAITNTKLDPDTVEIVTHSSHQPASVTVTGVYSASTPYDQTASEWAEELESFASRTGLPPDTASNYGSLDPTDVRRLSFISFADVVQSEHGGHPTFGSRDNLHLAGLTSMPHAAMNRSPSPIRSPVSSQGLGTSPPTSNPGSMKGLDLSPLRKPLGSPTSGHYNLAAPGDLNIETMSQALRRTGSTDLSHVRSIPHSPIEGPSFR